MLQCLTENNFFAKGSKYQFFQWSIEHLGHLVSAVEVRADPSKIEAMTIWPQPKNVKQLRGFLGLTGYYSRFVAHYVTVAAPRTELLKKRQFHLDWRSFNSLWEVKNSHDWNSYSTPFGLFKDLCSGDQHFQCRNRWSFDAIWPSNGIFEQETRSMPNGGLCLLVKVQDDGGSSH